MRTRPGPWRGGLPVSPLHRHPRPPHPRKSGRDTEPPCGDPAGARPSAAPPTGGLVPLPAPVAASAWLTVGPLLRPHGSVEGAQVHMGGVGSRCEMEQDKGTGGDGGMGTERERERQFLCAPGGRGEPGTSAQSPVGVPASRGFGPAPPPRWTGRPLWSGPSPCGAPHSPYWYRYRRADRPQAGVLRSRGPVPSAAVPCRGGMSLYTLQLPGQASRLLPPSPSSASLCSLPCQQQGTPQGHIPHSRVERLSTVPTSALPNGSTDSGKSQPAPQRPSHQRGHTDPTVHRAARARTATPPALTPPTAPVGAEPSPPSAGGATGRLPTGDRDTSPQRILKELFKI